MSIRTKLSLVITLGLLSCIALIFLISDRISTFHNVYNFSILAGAFFGSAAGLLVISLAIRKLKHQKIEKIWALNRLYNSFLIGLFVLFIIGLTNYEFTSPRPVPFGGEYHNTYKPPQESDDGWEISSLDVVNIDTTIYNQIVNQIVNNRSYKRIHSMVLVKNGKMIAEEYFYEHNKDKAHDLRSATKSITSVLIGIAIDKQIIKSVNEKIYEFFPEYVSYENRNDCKKEITIKDLLTMSSCMECNDWEQSSVGNENKMYKSKDWVKFILDLPVVADADRKPAYCTGGVIVLGAIIANASGMSLQEFSKQHLFDPLGITNYQWNLTPTGRVDSGGHLSLTPRDMAKIGQLFLNDGVYKGKQIVSKQ